MGKDLPDIHKDCDSSSRIDWKDSVKKPKVKEKITASVIPKNVSNDCLVNIF